MRCSSALATPPSRAVQRLLGLANLVCILLLASCASSVVAPTAVPAPSSTPAATVVLAAPAATPTATTATLTDTPGPTAIPRLVRRQLPSLTSGPLDPRVDEIDGVPLADGRYFAQTAGGGLRGYAVEDSADGYAFWSAFAHFGGVDTLGYPLTVPYTQATSRRQAFQRGVVVFDQVGGKPRLEDLFDELHAVGADPELASLEGVPPLLPAEGHASATGGGGAAGPSAAMADLMTDPAIRAETAHLPFAGGRQCQEIVRRRLGAGNRKGDARVPSVPLLAASARGRPLCAGRRR